MKQQFVRVIVIVVAAGLIAGGLYLFSQMSLAQSLAPQRGAQHQAAEEMFTQDGGEVQRGRHWHDYEGEGQPPEAAGRRQQAPEGFTGPSEGSAGQQRLHREGEEGGSLLGALPGMAMNLGIVALVIMAVLAVDKFTSRGHTDTQADTPLTE